MTLLKSTSSTKQITCIYCHKDITVNLFSPNKQACQECITAGLTNPDKRTHQSTQQLRKNTLMRKYGVSNIRQIQEIKDKSIQTQIKKYGGYGFQSQIISNKAKTTMQNRYGVENIMKKDEFKRCGQDNPMTNIDIAKKVSITLKGQESKLKGKTYEEIHGLEKSIVLKDNKKKIFINKFLLEFQHLLDYFKFEFLDKEYIGAHYFHNFKCTTCNSIITKQWNSIQQGFKCPTCYPRNQGFSFGEKELLEFIKEIIPVTYQILENDKKTIAPKELDIYIPDLKVAIEYNGLYYHSEQSKWFSNPKYHMEKTNQCEDKGIRLIHIFEDEWIFKQAIVKERLKQILNVSTATRIHARQCTIKEIDSKVKNQFLEDFHIQGTDMSSIKLGAFYQDKLISVMTFSKGNRAKGSTPKEDIWELNRFCSDYNYHIPGIASKLLSHFTKNYEWKSIYSYADRRWSSGNLYRKLGFKQETGTRLNYWYVKDGKRIHRFGLRKTKDEPQNITEKTLRVQQGYTIIWDCGNLKFTLTNSP